MAWEADANDFTYSYVSPHAEDLLGYPQREWLKPGFWRGILHPDDALRVQHYCDSETAAGRDHSLDYRVVRADGQTLWVRNIVSMIGHGHKPLIRGLMIDISETKRTEEALRLSEQKFAKAFHASPDGLLLSRQRDGLLLEVNEGFCRLTGYDIDPNRDQNQNSLDLGIWADLDERARLVERLRRDGFVRDFSCHIRRSDGQIRLCEVSARPLLRDRCPSATPTAC